MANGQAVRNGAVLECEPFDRERIDAEIARIEAASEFARAPVMRRLLRFLVETTLAGGGSQLKAYSVAVDGLGRAPDFDSQSDSYPRVQVGRLRRMLATFYAQHGVADGIRLTVPQGGYAVTFADETRPPVPTPAEDQEAERMERLERWRSRIGLIILGALVVVVALALGAWQWWENRFTEQHPGLTIAPTMGIEIGAEGSGPDVPVARAADAFLIDALRRSRLVRLNQDNGAFRGNEYRLVAEVSSSDQPTLFLRLWRNDINRLLWSGVVKLPRGGVGLQAAMMPVIVELVQPFGVIASDQRARHNHDFAPGYACLLQLDQYRRNRDHDLAPELDRCLRATLAIDPHQPAAIAGRALLLLDEARFYGPPQVDASRLERAATLAGQAVAVDPYSPEAQFAAAEVAFTAGSCGRARESGRRALSLDSYDPDLLGRVGRIFADCGDPRGLRLIEHALELDPDPPAEFFTPLVLAELTAGDAAGALATADRMSRPGDSTAGLYEITLATALAANGKTDEAKTAWARAAAIDRGAAGDPAGMLQRWRLTPADQALVTATLTKAGVLSPPGNLTTGAPAAAAPQPASRAGKGG